MKKRWVALYVENNVGVLAKISGLFSGKAYNLESLTVGTTEDVTVSRITLRAFCTDETFEQIKKQLNRMVDIIKVMDLSEIEYISKELMFIKILSDISDADRQKMIDENSNYDLCIESDANQTLVLKAVNTEDQNNELVEQLKSKYEVQIIRGGSVAIEI